MMMMMMAMMMVMMMTTTLQFFATRCVPNEVPGLSLELSRLQNSAKFSQADRQRMKISVPMFRVFIYNNNIY
jgi:hypothetical protein